ncbi:thymidine kinase [Candidatus Nomurabacteria bacterium]|nr:thymidine kinase [Candidatus Nomurabacteria bacterium]
MAKLHFKYGAMNSGKSDTLIKTAYNYEERGLDVATIKPAIDTKGDDRISARGGHERRVDILADKDTDIRKSVHELGKSALACVLVDEAQFLNEDQVCQLFSLAKQDDISVIAYGLRTDFRTEMFPGSKRLLELADNIEKLPTMCFCSSQAEFNTRKVNGDYVFDGSQVAIDGENDIEYDSLCGKCYQREGGKI